MPQHSKRDELAYSVTAITLTEDESDKLNCIASRPIPTGKPIFWRKT